MTPEDRKRLEVFRSPYSGLTIAEKDFLLYLLDASQAQLERIANSGVVLEDPRVGYVTVQIDADLWDELKAMKEASNG